MAYSKSSKVLKYWLIPLFSSISREIQRKMCTWALRIYAKGSLVCSGGALGCPEGGRLYPANTHKRITLVQHGIKKMYNKINKKITTNDGFNESIYHWLTTTPLRVDLSLNLFCSFFCEENEWYFDLYLDICSSHSQTLTYTRSSH